MSRVKLNSVFPNWLTGAIFTSMSANLPWISDSPALNQDIEYFGNHSGEKAISNLVKSLLGSDSTLSNSAISTLSSVILGRFQKIWEGVYNTVTAVYEPLEAYNIAYQGDGTDVDSGTVGDARTYEKSGSTTDSHSGDNTGNQNFYGFNSTAPVPTDTSAAHNSSIDTESFTNRVDIDNNTRTLNTTKTLHNTGTRHGNIGLITQQRLIKEEREVKLYDFFNQVYSDVDKVLALEIYDD